MGVVLTEVTQKIIFPHATVKIIPISRRQSGHNKKSDKPSVQNMII